MRKPRARGRARMRSVALAAATCIGAGAATAAEISTENPDVSVRWDNTLKYSAAWRVENQDPLLLRNPNLDDGDRNFSKGLISNRADLFSEFDVVHRKRHGLRVSGAAWYDSVYNRANDNPGFAGGAFPNHVSTAYNQFTDATRKVHGRQAELLDAFAFTGLDLGDTKLNIRAGQHTVLWGESLFFGANAIAGGMAPVDVVKLLSVPGTQFKEAIRPVPQVSAQWQLNPAVSVGAYYQFKFEPSRLPAVGSYFSGTDTLPEGAERILLGPVASAPRLADKTPGDSGQGGLQLRWSTEAADFGLYAIRFHEKVPQLVPNLGPGFVPRSYQLVYPAKITALGASASRTFGSLNLAVEASVRRNQDLASTKSADVGPAFGRPVTNDTYSNAAFAVGKTAHVNVSGLWTLPETALYRDASLVFEVAWNRVLSITKNASAVDPNSTRDAASMRFRFEPVYRQVMPGLDIGVPIGVGYTPKGSRSRALGIALPPENGGDATVGLNATYLQVWNVSVAYTHFFGSAGPLLNNTNNFTFQQYLKDRNFVSLSVQRTF